RPNAVGAVHHRPVPTPPLADAAEGADAPVLPGAGDHVGSPGVRTHDRLATRAHQGVKRLDAVDPVPEQVGVVLLQRARAVRLAADDVADLLVLLHAQDAGTEP